MAKGLCETCAESIWCPTWGEWKCKAKSKRIYSDVTKCSDYKKRDKNFKEPRCQCDDCLKNEALWDLYD